MVESTYKLEKIVKSLTNNNTEVQFNLKAFLRCGICFNDKEGYISKKSLIEGEKIYVTYDRSSFDIEAVFINGEGE